MKRAWGVGVLAAAMMVGCGGRSQDGGLVDGVPNTAECVRSGVDGVTCYPSEGFGRGARPVQPSTNQVIAVGDSSYGDRIPNLKFVGFRATTTAERLDTTQGTTVVQLADYFDPKSEKYSLIVLNACTRWCGICHQFAAELREGVAATYAPKGVVFMQAITEGLDSRPATIADLEGYAGDVTPNFTLLVDPSDRTLGMFESQPAWPFFVVVDARTMEIVLYTTGEPQRLPAYLDRALAMVNGLAPKP